MKVGVCIFDDIDFASSGWASIDGSEAVRIESMSSLATDTLWVTNLNFYKFKKLNLINTPHIFDYQYFRTSLKLFEEEFGIESDPALLASMMSGVFSRTVMFGHALLGIELKSPEYRYTLSLQKAVKRGLFRTRPRGVDAPRLLDAWEQATQQNQSMFNVFAPRQSRVCSFTVPRGAYFKWLLSQQYPADTNWSKVSISKNEVSFGVEDGIKIAGTDKVIDKLNALSQSKVAIFRVRVESIDPFFETFASFGTGKRSMRNYAAIPEIIRLADYAKVTLLEGFQCDAGTLPTVSKINLDTREYSLSRSLLLENLVATYGSKGTTECYLSPINAYLHAYDRMACSYFASVFVENGFIVGSYSNGRLMVYVESGDEELAASLAFKIGLVPPAELASTLKSPIKYVGVEGAPKDLLSKIGEDYLFNVCRSRTTDLTDRNKVIIGMDQVPLLPNDQRAKMLGMILNAAPQSSESGE